VSMKIYISGPITNHGKKSVTASFLSAEGHIKRLGHASVNPLCVEPPKDLREKRDIWLYCMRKTIPMLMEADAVYMLKGWKGSKGAVIERNLALSLGIPVFYKLEDLYIQYESQFI